jgi:tRNA A-37 threonylcarbamoyl transferase component Bud32
MNEEFISLVNRVVLRHDGAIPFVEKSYTNIAVGTGIPVPIARWQIEQRILVALNNLQKRQPSDIRVPKIISFNEDNPSIRLEFISGEKLTPELTISQELFHQLGRWLGKVENNFYLQRNEIFDGLWDVQKTNCQILSKLKGDLHIDQTKETGYGFSLGDVGFKNIISSSSAIYLIDFEFGHISFLGRDVGQLSAQLSVFKYNLEYEISLINGYCEVGGRKINAYVWKDVFKKYYLNKGGVHEWLI